MMNDQYCLKWNSHTNAIADIAYKFLEHESLVDVTLVCQEYNETHFFKAHQIILSACSPYFESLFLHNTHPHPIVYLKDVRRTELEIILTFMYRGEVDVKHDKIMDVLNTAKSLMVRGLGDNVCEMDSFREPREMKRNLSPGHLLPKKRKIDGEALSLEVDESGVEDLGDNYAMKDSRCNSPSTSYTSSMTRSTESVVHMNSAERAENNTDSSVGNCYRMNSSNQSYENVRRYEEYKMNFDRSYDTSPNSEYVERKSLNLQNTIDQRNQYEAEKSEVTNRYMKAPGQEISVIQANSNISDSILSAVSLNVSSTPHGPKRVGHFQLKWMELFNWLQYDKETKKMYCKFCRKWGDLIPNIRRTSFVDGSCNFRFEIVKHHDCSKSHRICVHKEGVDVK